MLKRRADEMPGIPMQMEGAKDIQMRLMVGRADGAPTFAMRHFTVAPGGHSPHHSHDYEHEVFVIEGEGTIRENEKLHPIKAGDVLYVCPNEIHQFKNTGDTPLKFLCLIPNSAMDKPITQAPECGVEN